MRNSYWCIDGDTKHFETLNNAKRHCRLFYTPRLRRLWLDGVSISHFIGDKLISYVTISVNDDCSLSYSRIVKIQANKS